MTTLREAAKAVLDCWDSPKWGWAPASPTADLMAALRAQLEQPEQEPVAWMYSDDHERMLETETFCTVYSVKVGSPDKGVTDVPLYTQPPQRKPLTDELYNELLFAVGRKHLNETRHQTALRYIRQAEMPNSEPAKAAHGIKGEA